jgi:hypothetical protein
LHQVMVSLLRGTRHGSILCIEPHRVKNTAFLDSLVAEKRRTWNNRDYDADSDDGP